MFRKIRLKKTDGFSICLFKVMYVFIYTKDIFYTNVHCIMYNWYSETVKMEKEHMVYE